MMLNCLVSSAHIQTSVGASRTLPFRLKRARSTAYLDVSLATQIRLESQLVGEAAMPPVYAYNNDPGADWANGLVPITMTAADITARVGTYSFWLTVVMPAGPKPVVQGTIEVLPRPVFAPVPLPGGGVYVASTVFRGYNSSTTVMIKRGMLVTRLGSGAIGLSIAAGTYRRADGIAIADIPPETPGLFFSSGALDLPNWTAVLGSTTLVPATTYYLDKLAGRITATVPARPDWSLLQVIGESDSASLLDLDLDAYEVEL